MAHRKPPSSVPSMRPEIVIPIAKVNRMCTDLLEELYKLDKGHYFEKDPTANEEFRATYMKIVERPMYLDYISVSGLFVYGLTLS